MYIPVVVEALDALVAVSAMLGGGVHVPFTQVAVDGVLHTYIHTHIHIKVSSIDIFIRYLST